MNNNQKKFEKLLKDNNVDYEIKIIDGVIHIFGSINDKKYEVYIQGNSKLGCGFENEQLFITEQPKVYGNYVYLNFKSRLLQLVKERDNDNSHLKN